MRMPNYHPGTPSTGGPVFVIAEAGVNHNGSIERARQLVHVAAESGADAVKFQSFNTDELVTSSASTAAYQRGVGDGSQRELLKSLEMTPDRQRELRRECDRAGIEFMSTPFDVQSLEFLVDQIAVDRVKIASPDLTNGPLLLAAARSGKELIVSTGMGNPTEIADALAVIAFGMIAPKDTHPTRKALTESFESDEGQEGLINLVALLHCTSAYPAPPQDVNLRAMRTLAERFSTRVGYSDHTIGTAVPVAAVALGASIIEKHFTLDRSLPGPDHSASLEPGELRSMIEDIRTIEVALGTPEKRRVPSEEDVAAVARRSLVAAREIKLGQTITPEDIAVKRPGSGQSPMNYWSIVGTKATRDFAKDDFL